MTRIAFALLLLFFSGCRPHSQRFYCREGASDFVMDSYLIQQGKLSILEMEGECIEELPCSALQEYDDGIAEDDILNIAIYHPTRKDLIDSITMINQVIGFRVTEGSIHIPDIPPVRVEGLSLNEARESIQTAFRNHIEDVNVFLSYKERLKRKVDIAGLTKVPFLPVDGKMRLYEVLSKAGIPPNANFFKSYVERDCQLLPVDMHKLVVEGDMCQNIVMRGGDKVYIADPNDSRVLIMGEVARATAIPLSYGFISLREALVMAGGIPYTGDRRYIQVIRGSLVNPKIYVLSWSHIIHLPNESLLLIPGDTVYVSETPLTRWNRFISQLLPSVESVSTCHGAYRSVLP